MSKINFIFNKGLTNEIVKNDIFMTTRDNILDPSTNIIDSSLNTFVRTTTGIGEQVDVSLNTPIDLSNIQAIVAFPKSVLSKNPTVGKIRYEIDNSNTQFQLDEIQMWVDNSNILPIEESNNFNKIKVVRTQVVNPLNDQSYTQFSLKQIQLWVDNLNVANLGTTNASDGAIFFTTVRLQARADNLSATLNAKELQVWVEGVNIALTTNSNPRVNASNYYSFSAENNANNNTLDGRSFSSSGGNAYLEYVFSTPIDYKKLDGIVWVWSGHNNFMNYQNGQELILKNDNTIVASHSMVDFSQVTYTDGGEDMALFKGVNYSNATTGTRSNVLTNILSDSEPQVYIRTLNLIQLDYSNNLIDGDVINTSFTEDSVSVGNFCMVTLNSNYNLKNIQSVVLYNGTDPSGLRGCNLQLINSEGLIKYESDLDSVSDVFRYDGINIGSVSTFSNYYSNTNIPNLLDLSNKAQPSYDEEIPFSTSMSEYRNSANYNKVYKMLITANASESSGYGSYIYGTDIYPDYSYIVKTAVHAGALADGETGYVYITYLKPRAFFYGSTQNGITTATYDTWQTSHYGYSFIVDYHIRADVSSNTINTAVIPDAIITSSYSELLENNSIVHLNNKNITSGKFTSFSTGNYIDIDISTKSVKFNDIQSIVTYNYNTDVSNLDLSNQEASKIILYDENNIPIIEYKNNLIGDTSYNIYKYKGPNHDSAIESQIQKIKIETTDYTELKLDELQIFANNNNVAVNEKFQEQVVETLIATKSVTMPSNYNGGLMNFPQSIFNGAMGSNTKTVSGLTGDLAVFNGSYSITWSPNHTVPYSNEPAHYMFSATDSNSQYGDPDVCQFRYLNEVVPYDSNGIYTGSNYLTYEDDNGNSINATGEWFALEFPAYINFTKVHHITLEGSVNTFTWIGRDKNGTNRLLGTYSMSWNDGWWRSATITNNYYVNKIYLVITRKRAESAMEYMRVDEIFFDGIYEVSPAQIIYPNNSIVTASSTNGTDISSNIVDSKFNTYFLSEKGIGEFIDVSLNTPINFSDIQSIFLSSSPINTNPIISKIKYETISNVKLELNNFQVWVNGSNISNQITNHLSSKSGTDLSNVYDSNKNSYYLSDQGVGEYIQFDLSDLSFNYNDLEAIITYNYGLGLTDLSNQQSTKLTLYDDSNIPIIEYSNSLNSNNYNVYKYKGPSYSQDQLRNVRITTTDYTYLDISEIQIWSDQSNLLQNGNYTLTIKDSSENTYNSSLFTDGSINTIYNLEKGLGHYIDISLNNTIDVSKLESVIIYSDVKNSENINIKKIRFETTKNVPLQFNEIQIWRDNSNILSNFEIQQDSIDLVNPSFEEPNLSNYLTSESLIDTNKNFKRIVIDNSENSLHLSEVQVWKDNSNVAPFGTATITKGNYDSSLEGYRVLSDSTFTDSSNIGSTINVAANNNVMIIINKDGSLNVYGDDINSGSSPPSDIYTNIFSASTNYDKNLFPNLLDSKQQILTKAFVGVTSDGYLKCWGSFTGSNFNGLPTTNDFTDCKVVFSTNAACVLKSDGTILTWGKSNEGGTGNNDLPENNLIPTDNGYTAIYASGESFSAIKDDGTLSYWGLSSKNYIGSSGAPVNIGINSKIIVNNGAFVALKSDGSLLNWGNSSYGGQHSTKPSGNFIKVVSSFTGFAALNTDGSLVQWGTTTGTIPTGTVYIDLFNISNKTFLAVKNDGTLVAWGINQSTITELPTDNNYNNAKFISNNNDNGTVVALKSDGTIKSWGGEGSITAPSDNGYTDIFPSQKSFVAIDNKNNLVQWFVDEYQFNKIRIERTTTNNHIHLSEIQVWINGTNVATSATVTSSGDGSWDGWGEKEKINDEQHLDGSQGWHSVSGQNSYIELTLSTKYNIYNLESIVIYNRTANYQASAGCSLLLFDDSNQKYSKEISVGSLRHRFDGPSISNVSNFSSSISTTQIINSPETDILVIKEPSVSFSKDDYKFNKIRLERTSNVNHMHISEIQIWINGTNVATSANVTSSGDGSWSGWGSKEKINDGQHLDGSEGWHATNGEIGKYIELTLSTKHRINLLESIVIYNRNSDSQRIIGCSLLLFNDTDQKYSKEISVGSLRHRFDGPSISNVSSFSSSISTTQIINSPETTISIIKEPTISFSEVRSFYANTTNLGFYNIAKVENNTANYGIDNIINFGDFSQITNYNSINTFDNSGTWQLDLSESINYKDLQSIVIYNRMDNGGQTISDKMKTVKIRLIDFSGRKINEISPNSINFAYKIKGGASEIGYTSTESINYDVSRIIQDSVTNSSTNFNSDSTIRSSSLYVHNLDISESLIGWNTDNFILLNGNNTYHGNQNITYGNQILGLRKNQYISKNISSLDSGASYKIEFYNHKQNNTLDGNLSILLDNSQINNLAIDSSETTLSSFFFNASDTSHNIEIRNISTDINSIIWIDNFTFKQVISKLTDNNINTYHTESQQLGKYVDVDITTLNLNYKDIQSIVTYNYGNNSYDLSNQYATKLILYDDSNIPFIEYNNQEYNVGISSIYNVYKYKGPKHDTSLRSLKRIKLETESSVDLGINEIQVWRNNENVFKYGQEPNSSFILNGDSKSLTDLYSSFSLTLNGNPGFDNNGVHLIGSQYITIPQSILEFGTDNFTISLWTQTSVASGTPHILSLGHDNSNSWLLGSNGSVIQLYGYQQTSTGEGDTDFNFTSDNQTNNYIISRVGNKMKLFINGILKLDLDVSVSLPAQDYHIGYSQSNGSYYSGTIKRLDIWKNYGFSN